MSQTHSHTGTGARAAGRTAGTKASPASGTGTRAAHADTGPGLGTLLTQWMPAIGTLTAFALYTALSIVMWRANYAPSWDLGIFTQLLDQYARGQTPIVDIKGPGFHLWGDHFHPILILLTPLYWLVPSGLTLMIAQAALFASSVWPIASLARERLGTLGGWLVTGAYVFSWGLVNAVIAQFHEIAFAVPLLAFGLVWWMRGRRLAALIAIALLVFVKEDLGITVAVFGLVIWLRNRAETRAAIFLAAWGVASTVFAVAIFIPAFNVTGGYDYSGQLTLAETLMSGLTTKLGTAGFLVLAAGGIGGAFAVHPAHAADPGLAVPRQRRRLLGDRLPLLGRPHADRRCVPHRCRRPPAPCVRAVHRCDRGCRDALADADRAPVALAGLRPQC